MALSVAFRYPSFCRVVLGSLPSVKVSELREIRTVLLGSAHVQRWRIPSAVSSTASLRIHLVFSSPSLPPSAQWPSSFVHLLQHLRQLFLILLPVGRSCTASRLHFLLLQQLPDSWVPLAMVEFRWGQ